MPPISSHPPLRKHADPPGLWLVVLGGSVLLNSAIALLLHDYFQRLETAAIAQTPIAIALISSGTGKAVTSATPAPATPPSNSVSAPRSAAAAPSSATVAPAKLTLAKPALAKPAKPQTPRPAASPVAPAGSEDRPPAPEPAPPPADSANAAPSNAERSNSDSANPEPAGDRTSLRDTAFSAAPDSSPLPPVTEPSGQVASSGVLLPGFDAPPDPTSQQTQPTAAPPAIALNPPIRPLEVVLQVNLGDRGQLPAQQFKTFVSGEGGCIVTPEALHSFNQPLAIALTLDAQGHITETKLANNADDSVDNPSYTALAQCFLKTLTFPPGESSSPASPTPRVTVILQKR